MDTNFFLCELIKVFKSTILPFSPFLSLSQSFQAAHSSSRPIRNILPRKDRRRYCLQSGVRDIYLHRSRYTAHIKTTLRRMFVYHGWLFAKAYP